MNIKQWIKRVNRAVVRWAYCGALTLAKILPQGMFYGLVRTALMAALCHKGNRLYRNSIRSLDIAYGDEKTPEQKEALTRKTFERLAYEAAEAMDYVTHLQRFDGKVDMPGEERLKAVLERGKGAVAITAHFGNFVMMLYWLLVRGYPVNVLMRPPRDQKMADLLVAYFKSFGGNIIFTVPERECVQKSLKALRANEILFILIDQNYGAEARIFVDFFGAKAATGASPVVFAGRTGAGVVPVFFVREQGRIHIAVEPEVELTGTKGDSSYLKENMQVLTGIVEKFVRRYPEHWSWMHNRWKSKVAVSDEEFFRAPSDNAASAAH